MTDIDDKDIDARDRDAGDTDTTSPISDDNGSEAGKPLWVAIVAIGLLAALSLVPWGRLTDSKLKDYNLLSDIMPSDIDSVVGGDEFVDPELLAIMRADSMLDAHAVAKLDNPAMMEIAGDVTVPVSDASAHSQPSATAVGGSVDTGDRPIPGSLSPRAGGQMIIEDYTPDSQGLSRLRAALTRPGSRPARIAVMGDSYIEGDIFTSDVRRLLQDKFGGRGVGYMAANSQVAGFRPTVKQSSSGWTHHTVQQAAKSKYFTIAGEFYTGGNGATIRFEAPKGMSHLAAWSVSQLVFVAPAAGTITLEADGETKTYEVAASEEVQSITLNAETSSLKVTNNVPGLVLLGAWLQDASGVVVDCMSVRGDSGVNRRGVSTSLAWQMRTYVDYDLIILEYGINALTSKQRDYSTYGKTMVEVIGRVRQCYPNADIILMGIGDRGQKINGEARSFATAPYMVEAQREAARKAGVMFYDTRESMGGDGAIVRWRNDKLANGDYIHLNFNGGKALATTFVDALMRKVNE